MEHPEQVVTVQYMVERYRLKSTATARKYIRKFPFYWEDPLSAPMWALKEWEDSRAVIPETVSSKKRQEILHRQKSGKVYVPRRR